MSARGMSLRLTIGVAILATIPWIATAQQKESIWQKIQNAAKQPGQQPSGQQQPGQKPGKAGQTAPGNQANDTGPFTPPPGTKIDPVVMAPMEQGSAFAVSPIGIHVATLSHHGSRQVIIYDGVVGPLFDQLFMEGGGGHPVIFSPDGNHYAYCGAVGGQWTVMLDGKQLTQGTESVNGAISNQSCYLGFTSNSKHLYYTTAASVDASHSANRFVFDGKATPLGAESDMRDYAFSPDGNHVAYFIGDPDPRDVAPAKLWIDGKPAPYAAGSPMWSADSQHLYTTRTVPIPGGHPAQAIEVLYDGHPIMRGNTVRLFMPPVGNSFLAVVQNLARTPPTAFLVIGGREVPGSEVVGGQINEVAFSPDGKHYAAHYINANGRHYVFADGKKGLEYPGLTHLANAGKDLGFATYTADSSTLVYFSYDTTSGARYLVVNGQESDNLFSLTDTVLSPAGNHVLTEGSGLITSNGKTFNLPNVNPRAVQAYAMSFSPDSSHWALVVRASAGPLLYIDGVPQTTFSPVNLGPLDNISTRPYIWSSDSKHIAYLCRSTNPAANNDVDVCVDDKAVRIGSPNYYVNLTFTPDGNHLFWTRNESQGMIRIFADGKPVFDGLPTSTAGFVKETWQMAPEGNLLVLLQGDTALQRVSITASPSTNIGTMLAGQ